MGYAKTTSRNSSPKISAKSPNTPKLGADKRTKGKPAK